MKVTQKNSHIIIDDLVMTKTEAKKIFQELEDILWEPEESHRWLDGEVTRLRIVCMELQEQNDTLWDQINESNLYDFERGEL